MYNEKAHFAESFQLAALACLVVEGNGKRADGVTPPARPVKFRPLLF